MVKLALPDNLAPVLPCCPKVRTLTTCNRRYSYWIVYPDIAGQLFITAKHYFNHIYTINNLPLWAEVIRYTRASSLSDMCLHAAIFGYMGSTERSRRSPHGVGTQCLGGNRLESALVIRDRRYPVAPLEEIILAAESILRISKAPHQKEIRIQHLERAASDSDDIIREESVFVVGGSQ
ncbi:hypothetical protein DFH08DRAFT_812133 [Mycena albidolilacea]|uniref:Uncharacterized protein n=1 Tax=Mycena albidolilacea TaxID=1033008 RepID=A0AAD6ZU14_9AGAR|nr:hypothetical protein DFH08DRAFT_812133 [Mycena albidolilacea]